MCMFYPLGTCCPGPEALLPEALLPEALLYCVMRCLRAAQLAAPGLWAVPRMIGPELFECSETALYPMGESVLESCLPLPSVCA